MNQYTGLYDEVETELVVASRSGLRLVLFIAVVYARFFTPIVTLTMGAFWVFNQSFGVPWGWALLPTYLVFAFTLANSLLSAPIFVAEIPPLISFRLRSVYYLMICSVTFILVSSPVLLKWFEYLLAPGRILWPFLCLLSLCLPLVICCIVGGLIVAPRISDLPYKGGRTRRYIDEDGDVVYVRE